MLVDRKRGVVIDILDDRKNEWLRTKANNVYKGNQAFLCLTGLNLKTTSGHGGSRRSQEACGQIPIAESPSETEKPSRLDGPMPALSDDIGRQDLP